MNVISKSKPNHLSNFRDHPDHIMQCHDAKRSTRTADVRLTDNVHESEPKTTWYLYNQRHLGVKLHHRAITTRHLHSSRGQHVLIFLLFFSLFFPFPSHGWPGRCHEAVGIAASCRKHDKSAELTCMKVPLPAMAPHQISESGGPFLTTTR